jgi:dihydroorotate dehydrogenase electron transfer subunit
MAELIKKPENISKNHYLLKIKDEKISLPGQFINIRVEDNFDPLLRRPFSIYNQTDDIMEVVVNVVGKGTKIISEYRPGTIDIIGPTGSGFTILKDKNVLLIGGGVGNAPLYYLAKELKKSNCNITYIYGSRSNEFIYMKDAFSSISNNFFIMTDDGSMGEKGLVTDKAAKLLSSTKYDMIYTCGPGPMMKALLNISRDTDIEVSVENYFGCGVGICSGCAVETNDGFKRACVEGPVFNGKNLSKNAIL